MHILGDWDFLNWWWWKPIIEPLAGLAWLSLLVLAAALLYLLFGNRDTAEFRKALEPPDAPAVPSDEEEIADWMAARFPDVSEEEILDIEEILEEVIREDIHPEMAAEIERRGIPVRVMALPLPGTVKDVGSVPLAVWIPAMNAIEIYAGPMKRHCRGNPAAYRPYMGDLLLHEMAHALGLDEPKIKDFGV